jgi:hypothetical protein
MRKTHLLAGLVTGMLAVGTPITAHAADQYYMSARGGCSFDVVNDASPGGQFGGPTVWSGIVYLAVGWADGFGSSALTVSCELKVNGVSQGVVLGPTTGTVAAASVATLQFTATSSDVVTLCEHVTVNATVVTSCATAQLFPVVAPDSLVCPVLVALAPTVDVIFNPATLYIDPVQGDLYIQGYVYWDCPPY